jgi:CRP-like cAMP-binding protein
MLGELPVPAIEHLATRLRRRTVPAGAVLFEQGDPGGAFYVIVRGEAEIIGDGILIGTMGPGDSFGEIALVRDARRTATVQARTDLGVFELDRDAFLGAIGGYSPSIEAAQAVVARRLLNFSPAALGP